MPASSARCSRTGRAKSSRRRLPAMIDAGVAATGARFAGRSSMIRISAFLALAALPCLAASPAQSAAGTALDTYLAGVKTLRADFTQTVTDGRGNQVQRAN